MTNPSYFEQRPTLSGAVFLPFCTVHPLSENIFCTVSGFTAQCPLHFYSVNGMMHSYVGQKHRLFVTCESREPDSQRSGVIYMASKYPFVLPPNWELNAISWAARQAGQNYGTFVSSIRENAEKKREIEEAYKQELMRRHKEEVKRLEDAGALGSKKKTKTGDK